MKTLIPVLACISSAIIAAQAQVDPAPSTSTPAAYSIIARGPHHRVWAAVSWETNALGRVTAHTNSYTELAGGMHHSVAGEWVESQEIVEGFVGGAVGRHCQAHVLFANNLATAGAIDMELPDGKRLTSHIIGLCYFDAASGTNILIAPVKDCQGKILPPNQVIYEDAFENVLGSVRYTYTRNGCEQDIIILESPPPPEAYSLSAASTRLVVMTEFINPPQPVQQVAAMKDEAGTPLLDETLDFGALQIGEGKGLLLGSEGPEPEVRVWKQWAAIEGR